MSDGPRYPRWRLLVDGDRVAVDPGGAIASVGSGLGGFSMAPEALVDVDGTTSASRCGSRRPAR